MSASLFLRVSQNSLNGFKVCMNIGHDRELHLTVRIAASFHTVEFSRQAFKPTLGWTMS
jgi:hypothetical protein